MCFFLSPRCLASVRSRSVRLSRSKDSQQAPVHDEPVPRRASSSPSSASMASGSPTPTPMGPPRPVSPTASIGSPSRIRTRSCPRRRRRIPGPRRRRGRPPTGTSAHAFAAHEGAAEDAAACPGHLLLRACPARARTCTCARGQARWRSTGAAAAGGGAVAAPICRRAMPTPMPMPAAMCPGTPARPPAALPASTCPGPCMANGACDCASIICCWAAARTSPLKAAAGVSRVSRRVSRGEDDLLRQHFHAFRGATPPPAGAFLASAPHANTAGTDSTGRLRRLDVQPSPRRPPCPPHPADPPAPRRLRPAAVAGDGRRDGALRGFDGGLVRVVARRAERQERALHLRVRVPEDAVAACIAPAAVRGRTARAIARDGAARRAACGRRARRRRSRAAESSSGADASFGWLRFPSSTDPSRAGSGSGAFGGPRVDSDRGPRSAPPAVGDPDGGAESLRALALNVHRPRGRVGGRHGGQAVVRARGRRLGTDHRRDLDLWFAVRFDERADDRGVSALTSSCDSRRGNRTRPAGRDPPAARARRGSPDHPPRAAWCPAARTIGRTRCTAIARRWGPAAHDAWRG